MLCQSPSAEVITLRIAWRSAFTAKESLAGGETRRLFIAAPSHATPSPAADKVDLGRRGRPNAQASVGFVPGAKAHSAHQSRGLASLVRVTWCFDCSPHGSAGSTGRAEAVVGITCPKPAGRRCWVATAGDCTERAGTATSAGTETRDWDRIESWDNDCVCEGGGGSRILKVKC